MKIFASSQQRSGSSDNVFHFATGLIPAAVAGCSEAPTGASFLDRTHRIELEDALALVELHEGIPEDADTENPASPSHRNPFAPLSGDYGPATLRLPGFADVDGSR